MLIQDQPNSAASVNSIDAITIMFLIQILHHVAPCKNCKHSYAKYVKKSPKGTRTHAIICSSN